MRKVKRFFGTRRRWPDSPYRQIEQAKWDLAEVQHTTPESFDLYHHLQSLEGDLMNELTKLSIPMTEHSVGRLNGGFPLGTYFTTAGYNPRPQMLLAHRLQQALNNGLQGKIMICLEDSYSQPHYVPYNDFDKILVETPDAVVRTPNW